MDVEDSSQKEIEERIEETEDETEEEKDIENTKRKKRGGRFLKERNEM